MYKNLNKDKDEDTDTDNKDNNKVFVTWALTTLEDRLALFGACTASESPDILPSRRNARSDD